MSYDTKSVQAELDAAALQLARLTVEYHRAKAGDPNFNRDASFRIMCDAQNHMNDIAKQLAKMEMDNHFAGTVIHGTLRHEDLIPAFHAELVRVAPKDVKIDPPSLEWGGIEVERLMDELNKYAPDGLYFGSHPGDGSDFGWWEYEE